MGIADRLKKSFRAFTEKPGHTVSLRGYESLLDAIGDREADLEQLSDQELTAAATELLAVNRDADEPVDKLDQDQLIEVCALGREAGPPGAR